MAMSLERLKSLWLKMSKGMLLSVRLEFEMKNEAEESSSLEAEKPLAPWTSATVAPRMVRQAKRLQGVCMCPRGRIPLGESAVDLSRSCPGTVSPP